MKGNVRHWNLKAKTWNLNFEFLIFLVILLPIPIPINKQSSSGQSREEVVVDNSEQRTISGYGQQFNLNFLFTLLNQIIQRKLSVFGTSGVSSNHNNPNKNIEFSVKIGGNGQSSGSVVESNPQVVSSGSTAASGSTSGGILSSLNPLNYINPSAIISSLAPTVLSSLNPLNLFGRDNAANLETKIDINSEGLVSADDNAIRVESRISTDQIDQSIVGSIKNDGNIELKIKSGDQENIIFGSNKPSDIDPTEK